MSVSAGLRSEARAALGDYRFLVERGYPSRPSIDLVGNRYRLTREERNMLFRGVVSRTRGRARRERLISAEKIRHGETRLRVDGYNVLYTVLSYLRGVPVFVCTDGVLRDVSAAHGRRPPSDKLRRAVELMTAALGALEPQSVTILLDSQLGPNRELVALLQQLLAERAVAGELHSTASVDAELIDSRAPAVVAGSDSVVLDRVTVPVFDLARFALEQAFQPRWLDLEAETPET